MKGRAVTLRQAQSWLYWSGRIHLGVAENQLQLGVRVATGSPEPSLDGGKDGGPFERNKRWNKWKRRLEGLVSLIGGGY